MAKREGVAKEGEAGEEEGKREGTAKWEEAAKESVAEEEKKEKERRGRAGGRRWRLSGPSRHSVRRSLEKLTRSGDWNSS